MARRHSAAEGGQERAQWRHATQQSCFRVGYLYRHLDLLTHTCMAHMVIRTYEFSFISLYLWLKFVKMQLCKSSWNPLQIRDVDPKQVETVIIIGDHDLCAVTLVKCLACLQACTGDLLAISVNAARAWVQDGSLKGRGWSFGRWHRFFFLSIQRMKRRMKIIQNPKQAWSRTRRTMKRARTQKKVNSVVYVLCVWGAKTSFLHGKMSKLVPCHWSNSSHEKNVAR